MGTWIAIAIVIFALGTIMALKPSTVEVRLDKLRMVARRLELNPKVIPCPNWIRGRNNELGHGMIGQYALILDDMKFHETHYQAIDGVLRLMKSKQNEDMKLTNANNLTVSNSSKLLLDEGLDDTPIDLPTTMLPLIKGVYIKANSLVVFWDDNTFVQPSVTPKFSIEDIELDLKALKSTMQTWAHKLARTS